MLTLCSRTKPLVDNRSGWWVEGPKLISETLVMSVVAVVVGTCVTPSACLILGCEPIVAVNCRDIHAREMVMTGCRYVYQ